MPSFGVKTVFVKLKIWNVDSLIIKNLKIFCLRYPIEKKKLFFSKLKSSMIKFFFVSIFIVIWLTLLVFDYKLKYK